VRHFAPTEAQGDFGFVALFQKPDQITQLDLIIAFIGARAKFHLFNLNLLLLELGFVLTLALLVFELAVVHQAAHRRLGLWGDLYQIDFSFFSHSQRFGRTDNPERFSFQAYQTNFRPGNFTVDACFFILSDSYDS
jgi:hypothetical protein